MTVAELIAQLQILDSSLRVLTRGYEGGYWDVKLEQPRRYSLNVNCEWYYDPHERADDRPDAAVQEWGIIL